MYLIKCEFCVSHFTVRNLSSTTSMCPATLFRFSGLKMWCQNAASICKKFPKVSKIYCFINFATSSPDQF